MIRGPRLYAEPNITPFVDVLLVLLIVFMLSVRLSQTGLDVSLPAEAARGRGDAEIVLEYSADRRITVNSETVSHDALPRRLREIYHDRRNRTMWLAGDGSLRYGEVVEVIDIARGAGVSRVGVITPELRNR